MIFPKNCIKPEASFKNEEIKSVKINDCLISVVKT